MKYERLRVIQVICLLIISGFVVAWGLYLLGPVLVPLVLALFLAIALKPLVDLQVRKIRLPHKLAVITTLLIGFCSLAILGAIVIISARQAADNAAVYKDRVNELVQRATDSLPEEYNDLSITLGQSVDEHSGPVLKKLVEKTTSTVMNVITTGFLVFIILCFLLFGTGGLTTRPPETWVEIETQTRKYIITKTLLSATTGTLVGLTLWCLGVELALLFGLLAVMLNFIPSVGSVIATLLPLPMVILDPESSTANVVLVFLIPLIIQCIIGNGLEPRIMGKSLKLHPITLILALIFWGMLWGFIGMFLAVPLTAVLRILLDKNPLTRPVAELLGGNLSKAEQLP